MHRHTDTQTHRHTDTHAHTQMENDDEKKFWGQVFVYFDATAMKVWLFAILQNSKISPADPLSEVQ